LFASWRPAYLFLGVLMAMLAVCFIFTLPAWKRPKPHTVAEASAEDAERGLMDYRTSLWATLLRLVTWVSIIMFLLYTGAEFTLGTWTYTVLTEGRGVSPQLAGIWAAGFWATFTIGRVLAGLYAHRVRLNTMMLGAMILALVGAVWFWWNPIALIGISGVLIVGFAMAPIFPGLVSSTSLRVGRRHAGNTIGIQISAAGLGGAVLPALAGFLAQRLSLETIPALLCISLLALLILYMLSTRVRLAE
jgi:fucose permease